MSYDIRFEVNISEIDEWVAVGDCSANTTWNLRDMIVASTGLAWKNEEDNGLCVDVIPRIQHGLHELTTHPSRYKKYESPNGYGTLEGCKDFFKQILSDWDIFCGESSEKLINITHFWIW